ncbi:MAG: hypothetical protein IPK85_22140 [Gemmatimonadetes bacterium]|nr:hypothetical protein [Gemmatimonadota bacterium]
MRTTVFALLLTPSLLAAQNEAALRQAFEGKLVSVKMAMPGTSRGVEVNPQQQAAVNFRQVADRIKDFGTALKIGDQVMVTKVVVKKDSHIEFQLGGGGFGTFGDDAGSSFISADTESESTREKALKDSIKTAPGPTRRKQLEKELANARTARERENDKARAEAAQANAAREANLRVKREQGGSRFNIRYKDGIPPEALTPEGVMAALANYVDFAATGAKAAAAVVAPSTAPTGTGGLSQLKKGLTIREVETLLGPADTAGEEQQGSMTVMKRSYTMDGMKVTASFVSGVLIDFAITPK